MKPLEDLRRYLERARSKPSEIASPCTCGHENHACVYYYRVDGKLVAAVVPETRRTSADDLAEVIGRARVERSEPRDYVIAPLKQSETPLRALEVLFDAVVYLDEALVGQPGLIFCPRMFLGGGTQCFQIPTREFLDLTHARVLPLTSASILSSDDWAV